MVRNSGDWDEISAATTASSTITWEEQNHSLVTEERERVTKNMSDTKEYVI